MPTDYRSLYGKEWLGAWDLTDGDMTVEITAVKGGELTSVGGRKSKKPVLSIAGTEKKLALNATNGKTVAALYGKYVEAWVGKRVTLYKSMTRDPNDGGETECVRIRPAAPTAAPQPTRKGVTQTGVADAATYLSDEQQDELAAALSRNKKSVERLLRSVSSQYGIKVEKLSQIKAVDFADAMAFASA